MSEIKVSKLTNRAGTGAPDFSQGVKISGTASTLLAPTRTEGTTEPTSPANGDTWYDTDNDTYDVYINDEWKRFIGEAGASFTWGGDKGYYLNSTNFANTFDITTAGNASSVSISRSISQGYGAAAGNGTKIVFAGGSTHDDCLVVTSATSAASTVTGALTFDHLRYHGACSNGTYMTIMAGRSAVANPDNQTQYLTIDSFSSATNGGDLTTARTYPACVGDATYGVAAGGNVSGTASNIIDYVTVATTTAASDFGDLAVGHRNLTSADDATRGIFAGGIGSVTNSDVIQYITTATPSNAIDFGDLTVGRYSLEGCSNGTRAVFVAGYQSSGTNVTMDYVTIQTLGNATDFGDITDAIQQYGVAGAGAAS